MSSFARFGETREWCSMEFYQKLVVNQIVKLLPEITALVHQPWPQLPSQPYTPQDHRIPDAYTVIRTLEKEHAVNVNQIVKIPNKTRNIHNFCAPTLVLTPNQGPNTLTMLP